MFFLKTDFNFIFEMSDILPFVFYFDYSTIATTTCNHMARFAGGTKTIIENEYNMIES